MDCIHPTGTASAAAAAACDLGDNRLGDAHLPDVFGITKLILSSGAAFGGDACFFGDALGDTLFGDADLHRGRLCSIQCPNDQMRELKICLI
jgi:hypothetical protein